MPASTASTQQDRVLKALELEHRIAFSSTRAARRRDFEAWLEQMNDEALRRAYVNFTAGVDPMIVEEELKGLVKK